ncbi:MAG: hypothetical protein HY720_09895 [Planctomycetes bacterium]|nr:hypothetical protein [Planctomycetota bacterium]
MRRVPAALVLAALALPAHADRDFVIVVPGGEGSRRNSKRFFEEWTGYLREKLAWPAESLAGGYDNDLVEGLARLRSTRPTFGVVGIDFYLAYRGAFDMRPRLSSRPYGSATQRYVVIAPGDGPTGLLALHGGKVGGKYLSAPGFVSGLIFGGDPASTGIELVPFPGSMDALAGALAGAISGVVVKEREWNGIREVPRFVGKFRAVHTSEPVLAPIVVVFGEPPADGSAEAFARALSAMGDDEHGKALLGTMQENAGFVPVDEETLARAVERYERAMGAANGGSK